MRANSDTIAKATASAVLPARLPPINRKYGRTATTNTPTTAADSTARIRPAVADGVEAIPDAFAACTTSQIAAGTAPTATPTVLNQIGPGADSRKTLLASRFAASPPTLADNITSHAIVVNWFGDGFAPPTLSQE
ncbi:hypothetical protein GCM10009765_08760 [Fodinicola feengrottensis]|uniref:Uncharacterized protein n=1 Tax=Fodinicola feengrottensis TaxID=435914 RepID=A0ABN2FXC4_9ACTN